MKKAVTVVALVVALCCMGIIAAVDTSAAGKNGEALFKQYCQVCHPNGGNIINAKKTLSKKDRDANNIKTVDDIVRNMRKPGPGMTPFSEKAVPDGDAKAIARYILKTFK
ncbi:MAG TPA: cytochrome C [Nitrospiraceae bacterium]|nr:cytochrome C [Nitrospiraceae bacterium]